MVFNYWLNGGNIPKYLYSAKVTALTKDKKLSVYPSVGDIRTIAVLPVITKLYETALLVKLKEYLT